MRAPLLAVALLAAASGGAAGSVIDADRVPVMTARDSEVLLPYRRPYLSAAEATALQYRERDLADDAAALGGACQQTRRGRLAMERC